MNKLNGVLLVAVTQLVGSGAHAQSEPSSPVTTMKNLLSVPKSVAGGLCGLLIAIPVTVAKKIAVQSTSMSRTLTDDMGGDLFAKLAGSSLGTAYGVTSGLIQGTIQGVERGVEGFVQPFGDETSVAQRSEGVAQQESRKNDSTEKQSAINFPTVIR